MIAQWPEVGRKNCTASAKLTSKVDRVERVLRQWDVRRRYEDGKVNVINVKTKDVYAVLVSFEAEDGPWTPSLKGTGKGLQVASYQCGPRRSRLSLPQSHR